MPTSNQCLPDVSLVNDLAGIDNLTMTHQHRRIHNNNNNINTNNIINISTTPSTTSRPGRRSSITNRMRPPSVNHTC